MYNYTRPANEKAIVETIFPETMHIFDTVKFYDSEFTVGLI